MGDQLYYRTLGYTHYWELPQGDTVSKRIILKKNGVEIFSISAAYGYSFPFLDFIPKKMTWRCSTPSSRIWKFRKKTFSLTKIFPPSGTMKNWISFRNLFRKMKNSSH